MAADGRSTQHVVGLTSHHVNVATRFVGARLITARYVILCVTSPVERCFLETAVRRIHELATPERLRWAHYRLAGRPCMVHPASSSVRCQQGQTSCCVRLCGKITGCIIERRCASRARLQQQSAGSASTLPYPFCRVHGGDPRYVSSSECANKPA